MKIPIPFARTAQDSVQNYLIHRTQQRYQALGSEGIIRLAETHARTLAEVQFRNTQAIIDSLDEGFEGVQQQQIRIHHALLNQTEVLSQNLHEVEVAIQHGFAGTQRQLDTLGERVEHLGAVMVEQGDRLFQGLAGLKASMDMGMSSIVSQFELQRQEIQRGLDQLADLLANQNKVAAHEHFREGKRSLEQYLKHPEEAQFLIDAEHYLNLSIELYRGNPFCHMYLGHLFQEASEKFELGKSLTHYHLAATYAKGLANQSLLALAYFHAAWICYVMGEPREAIELSKLSIENDPTCIPEAHYNLAKYYAHQGQAAAALKALEHAIRKFDPLYALKANLDADFKRIAPDLEQYLLVIKHRAASELNQKLQQFGVHDLLNE